MGKKKHPAMPPHAHACPNGVASPRVLLADEAAYGLARRRPMLSAHQVVNRTQRAILYAGVAAAVLFAILAPSTAWRGLTLIASLSFIAGTLFRTVLAFAGGLREHAEPDNGDTLPVYTILVPLYREANVVPQLVRALRALDYPDLLAQPPQMAV